MTLIETIKKQGGLQLVKQYWKSGAFFSSILEFLLLGKSHTALEIIRLSAELKIKNKLKKRYRKLIRKLCVEQQTIVESKSCCGDKRKIWVCWFQGIGQAPELVKKCYESLHKNIKDREIILITEENYNQYVVLPQFVQKKFRQGVISKTHFSDILRVELLLRYGGTWIDATVFCSSSNIPQYMLDSDLFLFQTLKPGLDGQSTCISSWFMTAKKDNVILKLTQCLLYEYWKTQTEMIDYFLLHDLFQLAIEAYPKQWHDVVPFSNSVSHILLLRLFDQYDVSMWQAIKKQTPFHKLSYKFSDEQLQKKHTYYSVLIRGNMAQKPEDKCKLETV